MRLDKYLKTNSLSDAEFGRRIGATTSAVRNWRLGRRFPQPVLLRAIQAGTGGSVTEADFKRQRSAAKKALGNG